jgi:hypothetical protein
MGVFTPQQVRCLRKFLSKLFVIAGVCLIGLQLHAQVNTGRISGAITDQSGGAVTGAKVTVTEVATGIVRPLTTDSAGQYVAPNLNPGMYTVRAEFMGFQTIQRQNIDLEVGGDVRVDVTLQPGEQSQTVTVTESLPVVNTTNAQTGGELSNTLLTSLPLSGRNYRWQQDLVPGVIFAPGHGTAALNVNGVADGHAGNNILDGVYAQTYNSSEVTFGGAGEAGDATILPLDAIQDVNVVTNPKAEYGWVPGVTASVGLKSGTNSIHGDAYAFGRGTALDAKNAFAASRFPLEFEQYGAVVGGPIKKDKLFYFMGFEGYLENLTTVVAETPPVLADTGNAGLSIPDAILAINKYNAAPPAGSSPGVPLNRLSLNLAGCNPNNAGINSTTSVSAIVSACSGGNQFGAPGLWANPNIGVLPNSGFSDNGLVKIDYHLNDHHTINGAFMRGSYEENAAGNSAAKIAQSYWEEVLGVIGQESRAAWVWTPNSSWLNEARWGLDQDNRPVSRAECTPQGDPFSNSIGLGQSTGNYGGPNYVSQYGLLSGAPACGFPTVILSSPVNAQLSFSNSRADLEKDDQFTDNVSYTRGTHQFKFGADVRAVTVIGAKTVDQQSGVINFGQSGAAAFTGANSLEDFLVGVPSSESIRGGNPTGNISVKFIDFFLQDDWRLTRKLTVNLGFRDEIITSLTSLTANLGNFAPGSPTGVAAGNSAVGTQNRPLPRLGFAWDINGKGTNTLRASFGMSGGVPTLQNLVTGGNGFDLSAAPSGETMFAANGSTVQAPGSGNSSIDMLLPTSGTAGATKGIVTSSPIVWPLNSQNSATTPLFPTPIPEQCGNGLAPTKPSAAGAPAINPNPCTTSGLAPGFHFYNYMFWNVNYQHAFTNNLSVDIGYVASRSYDLNETLNLNQVAPNLLFSTASQEQANAPFESQYPWFSTINYMTNGGNDNYRSLQIFVVQRPTHGLSYTLAYSFQGNYLSEGILNSQVPASSGTNGPYGASNYPTQRLAATITYNVPNIKSPAQLLQGWAATASISIDSALPFCVNDTKDDLTGAGPLSGTILGTACASGTPWTLSGPADPLSKLFGRAGTLPCYGVAAGTGVTQSVFSKQANCTSVAAGPAATPWANMPAACIAGATQEPSFTPALAGTNSNGSSLAQLAAVGCYTAGGSAIVPPAQGTYGSMLPYALHGAGVGLVNLSLTKSWTFKERYGAQFRYEVFNLFNRTQYYGDGLNLGAPNTFGAATGTPDVVAGGGIFSNGGPRVMQLGLKLSF